MSILIKGIDMPDGFAERCFVIRGDGRVRTCAGAVIDDATAVPVPPHGRLIDADALLNKLKGTQRYFDAKFDINEAPTILPASKEGEA